MNLYLKAPAQHQYNLVYNIGRFQDFVKQLGVKTTTQREEDAYKLALTNKPRLMWGKVLHVRPHRLDILSASRAKQTVAMRARRILSTTS